MTLILGIGQPYTNYLRSRKAPYPCVLTSNPPVPAFRLPILRDLCLPSSTVDLRLPLGACASVSNPWPRQRPDPDPCHFNLGFPSRRPRSERIHTIHAPCPLRHVLLSEQTLVATRQYAIYPDIRLPRQSLSISPTGSSRRKHQQNSPSPATYRATSLAGLPRVSGTSAAITSNVALHTPLPSEKGFEAGGRWR